MITDLIGLSLALAGVVAILLFLHQRRLGSKLDGIIGKLDEINSRFDRIEAERRRTRCNNIFFQLMRELRRRPLFEFHFKRLDDNELVLSPLGFAWPEFTVVIMTFLPSSGNGQLVGTQPVPVYGCEDQLSEFVDALLEPMIQARREAMKI